MIRPISCSVRRTKCTSVQLNIYHIYTYSPRCPSSHSSSSHGAEAAKPFFCPLSTRSGGSETLFCPLSDGALSGCPVTSTEQGEAAKPFFVLSPTERRQRNPFLSKKPIFCMSTSKSFPFCPPVVTAPSPRVTFTELYGAEAAKLAAMVFCVMLA